MVCMVSMAVESGVQITYLDCGTNTTLLHYKNYHATEFVRNRYLSFWSGDAYLADNITSGTVTFSAYRDDVCISLDYFISSH